VSMNIESMITDHQYKITTVNKRVKTI